MTVSNRSRTVCLLLFKTVRRQCFCSSFSLFQGDDSVMVSNSSKAVLL